MKESVNPPSSKSGLRQRKVFWVTTFDSLLCVTGRVNSVYQLSGPSSQSLPYSSFCSIKWLGVFLLPSGCDASPSQGYPPPPNVKYGVPIYTPGWSGERHCELVRCLALEHNTMSLARAWTQTTHSRDSRDKHTKYEGTAPPTCHWKLRNSPLEPNQ